MKFSRILPFWLLLIFVSLNIACSDNGTDEPGETDPPKEITLSVSPSEAQIFKAEGETITFKVETNAVRWTVEFTEEDEQFTLLPATGQFIVTASENISKEDKKAQIKVSAEGTDKTVVIDLEQTFKPLVPSLVVEPTEISFSFRGGEQSFFVDANVVWEAVISDDSWFEINIRSTYFEIYAPLNRDEKVYDAVVTVTGEGVEPITIPIHQEGMTNAQAWEGEYSSYGIDKDGNKVVFNTSVWSAENDEKGDCFLAVFRYHATALVRYMWYEDYMFALDFTFQTDYLAGGYMTMGTIIIVEEEQEEGDPIKKTIYLDRNDPVGLIYNEEEDTISTPALTHTHTDGKEYPVYFAVYHDFGSGNESDFYLEFYYSAIVWTLEQER